MDPFGGRSALGVGDVALERLEQELPGAASIGARKHPRMHHAAQRRAVRGPVEVVVDRSRDRVLLEVVSEAREELAELVGGEEVEEHEHVGLLRDLVAIGSVTLALENSVEAPDVAVAGAVAVPIELLELLVPLELAEDAVLVEDEAHLAAHVLPALGLLGGERE